MIHVLKRVALTIIVIMVLVKVMPGMVLPKSTLVAEVTYSAEPETVALIRVSNRGQQRCQNVTLSVPDSVGATVTRNRQDTVVKNTPQRLMLGELAPKQSLQVVALLKIAEDGQPKNISVSHKAGPGVVIVKKPLKRR